MEPDGDPHSPHAEYPPALSLLAQGDQGKASPALLRLIAQSITSSITQAGSIEVPLTSPAERPTLYHGHKAPPISVQDYLLRISKHTHVSATAFTAALLYIHVACKRDPRLGPAQLTVHRLVLSAVLVAAKFWDDDVYTNRFYAQVGGIRVQDLHHMELDMLHRLLSYQLMVPRDHLALVAALLASGDMKIGHLGSPELAAWPALPQPCQQPALLQMHPSPGHAHQHSTADTTEHHVGPELAPHSSQQDMCISPSEAGRQLRMSTTQCAAAGLTQDHTSHDQAPGSQVEPLQQHSSDAHHPAAGTASDVHSPHPASLGLPLHPDGEALRKRGHGHDAAGEAGEGSAKSLRAGSSSTAPVPAGQRHSC